MDMQIIKYGFTGTRSGLNQIQKESIVNLLKTNLNSGFGVEVHHGDCIGADSDFHQICEQFIVNQYFQNKITIQIHPPNDSKLRAYCNCSNIFEPKPYLQRNKDIVNQTDILIGCPHSFEEQTRSGTWMTIRYAKKSNKKILLF